MVLLLVQLLLILILILILIGTGGKGGSTIGLGNTETVPMGKASLHKVC